MKQNQFILAALCLSYPLLVTNALAEEAAPPPMQAPAPQVAPVPQADTATEVPHFEISGYIVEGATLLGKEEIDVAVASYLGKDKDFSDVQRAMQAIEALYAARGYSAVRVTLPEQTLEKGVVHLVAVESHFGKIVIKDNKFVSEANVLNALPSLRGGGVPRSQSIARELKLANENPARQLNVVLKAGEKEDAVDASVLVTDSKPTAWSVTFDNSGTKETGNTRLGLAYRHANLFDADHVATAQIQTSPQHTDRVLVVGGSYKIPRYQAGDSWEFFGGYSNVNSLVGGLTNFQGGGVMLSARNNWMLERVGGFDPRLSFGLDWRTFNSLKQTQPTTTVLYNEIVTTPLSVALALNGKTPHSDTNFNFSYAVNVPMLSKGKTADFAAYDPLALLKPDAHYAVLRYGASYARLVASDWQLRAALNGQWSNNFLILGEQMRLGGADGVRGFAEGSEGGSSGTRVNLESYTPSYSLWEADTRALVFYDVGRVSSKNGISSSIASAGIGMRSTYAEQFSLRADMAWITNAGTDPLYRKGDWRIHASLSATF